MLFDHSQLPKGVILSTDDRTSYKAAVQTPYPHPAHDSAASSEHSCSARKKDIELELTDVQRGNIRDMNEGIDQTRWRKWLTWFPRVRSAHAAIAAP